MLRHPAPTSAAALPQRQFRFALAAPLLALGLLSAALLLQPRPAWALYKVVGPDGKVTYTDRPGGAESGKTTTLRGDAGGAPAEDAALPAALRQAVQRYPVTLYSSRDCNACDQGRKLLQQRGVPFTEKHIGSQEDADALAQLVGDRLVPALTIGQQAVRGYSAEEWTSYLDAAGYPRESKLPRGTAQGSKAEPLTPRKPARTAAASAPEESAPAPAPAPATPGGIRF